jgi:hypothetical protein
MRMTAARDSLENLGNALFHNDSYLTSIWFFPLFFVFFVFCFCF